MQVRYVLALAALAGLVVAVGFMLHGRRQPPDSPPRVSGRSPTPPGLNVSSMPPAIVPSAGMIGRFLGAGGQPRLIANLAERVENVIVSVRQVYASDRVRNLMEESATPGPLGAWQLILQVNGVEGESSAAQWSLDVESVRALDNRGHTAKPIEPSFPLNGVAPVPNGRSFSVFLSEPDHEADMIVSLTGVLRPTGAPDGRARPFAISNVPLPNAQRLFGDITPYQISTEAAAALPHAAVLLGDEMERALSGARQDVMSSGLPYLRLVLPIGAATRLNALLPEAAPRVTLIARPEADGNIVVGGTIASTVWQHRIWDREPFLIVLQHRSLPSPLGLQLTVSRSDETVLLPAARAVFPVQGREPAGSIVVRLRVGSRPIGPASIPVSLSRKEGSNWSPEETTEAPVRANGEAVIGNLRAGRYRVRFHPERMSPRGAVRSVDVAEYLRDRYGLQTVRWSSSVSQEINVLPGGRSYGAPIEALAGK